MNRYQKQIHKRVKQVIRQQLFDNDMKYPIIKNGCRSVNHLFHELDIESKKNYRDIRNFIRKYNKLEFQ